MFSFAPAPGFFGLDQVNVGPIPHSFVNGGAATAIGFVSFPDP